MVLLLAHHFVKTGTVTLKCYSDGWTGDVVVRDVHVTAVQVGQLTDNGTSSGTGAPQGIYAQNGDYRPYVDTTAHDLQNLSIPGGTWLIRATAWAFGGGGNRVDCALIVEGLTADQSFEDLEGGERTISLEGTAKVNFNATVTLRCNVAKGGWIVYGSAISAVQVGTLKYGQLGGTLTTSGSGSPTVVGGDGGPGCHHGLDVTRVDRQHVPGCRVMVRHFEAVGPGRRVDAKGDVPAQGLFGIQSGARHPRHGRQPVQLDGHEPDSEIDCDVERDRRL